MNSLLEPRKLGIILGFVFASGVGIYFYQQAADKKEQEAKSALYKIQKTYEEESNAIPAKDREAGTTLDVDAKFSKTVSELQGMMNAKTAPPRVLFEAGLKLGSLYLSHNQVQKAVAPLKTSSEFAKSGFQKASIQYLVGVASERNEQFKDALDAYQKGVNENVDGLKGECLVGMIRMSIKLGDKEKAKLFSEKANKELQGTKYADLAMSLVKGMK